MKYVRRFLDSLAALAEAALKNAEARLISANTDTRYAYDSVGILHDELKHVVDHGPREQTKRVLELCDAGRSYLTEDRIEEVLAEREAENR